MGTNPVLSIAESVVVGLLVALLLDRLTFLVARARRPLKERERERMLRDLVGELTWLRAGAAIRSRPDPERAIRLIQLYSMLAEPSQQAARRLEVLGGLGDLPIVREVVVRALQQLRERENAGLIARCKAGDAFERDQQAEAG